MNLPRKLFLLIKEIGVSDLVSYTRYQLELRSGWLKRRTPPGGSHPKRELLLEAGTIDNTWHENWHNSRFSNRGGLLQEEAGPLMSGRYRRSEVIVAVAGGFVVAVAVAVDVAAGVRVGVGSAVHEIRLASSR